MPIEKPLVIKLILKYNFKNKEFWLLWAPDTHVVHIIQAIKHS